MTTKIYNTGDDKAIKILNRHVRTQGGNFKGVCVSALLAYFDIDPSQYKYTWSKRAGNNYDAILRRFGWSVRSRKSAFRKYRTVGSVRRAIKSYSDHTDQVAYMIKVASHVILLSSEGETIVDTDPRRIDRRTILQIQAVYKA